MIMWPQRPGPGNFLENVFDGNFLVYDFCPPLSPPISYMDLTCITHMDIIGHVAAAPGPLSCPSRSARPPNMSYPQRSAP